jgi:hypothetical protein
VPVVVHENVSGEDVKGIAAPCKRLHLGGLKRIGLCNPVNGYIFTIVLAVIRISFFAGSASKVREIRNIHKYINNACIMAANGLLSCIPCSRLTAADHEGEREDDPPYKMEQIESFICKLYGF